MYLLYVYYNIDIYYIIDFSEKYSKEIMHKNTVFRNKYVILLQKKKWFLR